jgi:hypothetical protein
MCSRKVFKALRAIPPARGRPLSKRAARRTACSTTCAFILQAKGVPLKRQQKSVGMPKFDRRIRLGRALRMKITVVIPLGYHRGTTRAASLVTNLGTEAASGGHSVCCHLTPSGIDLVPAWFQSHSVPLPRTYPLHVHALAEFETILTVRRYSLINRGHAPKLPRE